MMHSVEFKLGLPTKLCTLPFRCSYATRHVRFTHRRKAVRSTRRGRRGLAVSCCRDRERQSRLQVVSQSVINVCKTGYPQPLGISLTTDIEEGKKCDVNFAVVSRNATSITLCLFRKESRTDSVSEEQEIVLDSELNRTGDVWHTRISGLIDLESLYYGWKADGSYGYEGGSRFHPQTVLLDPYSHLVMPVKLPGASEVVFLGSLAELVAPGFNWEQTSCPRYGYEELRISELNASVFVEDLKGMVQKLSDVGINAVVLKGIPLDSGEDISSPSPLSFFAPNQPVFNTSSALEASNQLKQIIKELHKNSIEVFMEVQYCFTSETKTILSLKGVDVSLYFRGKGVLNCGQPVVQDLILASLRHWKLTYKVDGFAFVNSETMTQDRDGIIQDCPALPEAIASDPLLRWCKLIAVSGNDELVPRQGERGYPHWAVWTEYNTRFQFDFWEFMVMGTAGKLSNIATRITGSPDLFSSCWDGRFPGNLAAGRRPAFGFNSPVTFSKHLTNSLEKEAPHILTLKSKEASLHQTSLFCALLVATCVSQGVPVFPEDCFTTQSLLPFINKLMQFRKTYASLIEPSSFEAIRHLSWHGVLADQQPDWDGLVNSQFIGYSTKEREDFGFYAAFNASHSEVSVQAPQLPEGYVWRCIVYTAVPNDDEETLVPSLSIFNMDPQTAVIMEMVDAPTTKQLLNKTKAEL